MNWTVSLKGLVTAVMAALALGCAATASEGDSDGDIDEDVGANLGEVATTYYSCQTATISNDGAKWVYQTSFFTPSSPSVYVSVERWKPQGGVDDFGGVSLSRKSNGTFTDGTKLTLAWNTKSNGQPSVQVTHHTAGLFAASANGFCTKTVVDLPTHTPHNFFYGGRSFLSRKWKVYRVGGALVDSSDPYVIDLDIDPVSDPSKSSNGLISLEAPCNPIPNAPATGIYANNTRAGIMGLISTALNIWSAFSCAQQGGVSQQLAGLQTFIGTSKLWKLPKAKFETPCGGNSSETLYANGYLYSNPNAIFVMCIRAFQPTKPEHQPYLHVIAANPVDFAVSPKMTFIPAD
ncbi:MAG: hypothetical protein IPK82_35075 [Polyangiaceae bacterium]|nr:hypothetical protein [Polyangiaceae bacterium]